MCCKFISLFQLWKLLFHNTLDLQLIESREVESLDINSTDCKYLLMTDSKIL